MTTTVTRVVPAWLVAAALAAILAAGVPTVILAGGGDPAPARPVSTSTTISEQPTTCIDSELVGHC